MTSFARAEIEAGRKLFAADWQSAAANCQSAANSLRPASISARAKDVMPGVVTRRAPSHQGARIARGRPLDQPRLVEQGPRPPFGLPVTARDLLLPGDAVLVGVKIAAARPVAVPAGKTGE